MTFLLILVCLGLGYAAGRVHTSLSQHRDDSWQSPLHLTVHDTLQELKAREELERDYEFVIPSYGMLNGEKIPLGRITRSVRENSAFIAPRELGKWEKKKVKKGVI